MARKKKSSDDIIADILVGTVGSFFSLLAGDSGSKNYKNSRYKTRKPRSKKSWF
ncbi:hypothetical protein IKL64_03450 [bacterium]|nr:hypothetical protein [bacterium]